MDTLNPSNEQTEWLGKHRVGSRELKTRLGTYLRLVKEGATLIITDRGRPVAELRPLPIPDGELEERLYALASRGVIAQDYVAERQPLAPFEPIESSDSASRAILEDREDRF